MYTRQEASMIRKNFWTSFGQYMKPLPSADGDAVNWLNYKTGIKGVYFRMEAEQDHASIGIELRQADEEDRKDFFERLQQLKSLLKEELGEDWHWEPEIRTENGTTLSRIWMGIDGVSVFNSNDWPALISFLKPRLLALDAFWATAKYSLQ